MGVPKRLTEMQTRFCEELVYNEGRTTGYEACIAAAAMGARIIEKHITLNKKFSSFRDHALSADYIDLKNLNEYLGIQKYTLYFLFIILAIRKISLSIFY